MVGFEAVISHVITTQYHNQTQQHHLLYDIKHDIQTTLLPLINLVSYYITLHYTTLHYTHAHTIHSSDIFLFSFTDTSVNTKQCQHHPPSLRHTMLAAAQRHSHTPVTNDTSQQHTTTLTNTTTQYGGGQS